MADNKYSAFGHPKGKDISGTWTRNGGTEGGSAESPYEHPQGKIVAGAWVRNGGEDEHVSFYGNPKGHVEPNGTWLANTGHSDDPDNDGNYDNPGAPDGGPISPADDQ